MYVFHHTFIRKEMQLRREEREKIFVGYIEMVKKLKSRVDYLESRDRFKCPICWKEYDFKKIVCLAKCGHTLCSDCAGVPTSHCHICRTNCSRSDKIKIYI